MTDINLLSEMIQECELMINILSKRLLVLKGLLPGGVSAQGISGPGTSVYNEIEAHKQAIGAELQRRRLEMEEQMRQTMQTMMDQAAIKPTTETDFSKLLENPNFLDAMKKFGEGKGWPR